MKTVCTLREDRVEDMNWYATGHLFKEIKRVLSDHAICVIALSGGRSVQGLYNDIVANSSFLSEEEWQRIHFVYADERVVPPTDPQSNYKLTKDVFLDALTLYVHLPQYNIHRYYAEGDDPQAAMQAYSREIQQLTHKHFHILIEGVGEDGHIASLFPHSRQLTNTTLEYLWVDDSPKPPQMRITISPQHVRNADATFLFFVGKEKQQAYEDFVNEKIMPDQCPAKLSLEGEPQERLYVITDRQ